MSTIKQEQEGLSLKELQLPTLRNYCKDEGILIDKEFEFQESADAKIRKKFNEMIDYVTKHKDIKAIVAYRVDRITRNYRDAVLIDDLINTLGLEIHFVYDRLMIDPKTVGRDITDWDTKVFLAKQFLNRLKEDAHITRKRKFENQEWPSAAPFGYINITLENKKKWIEPDPFKSILIIKIFEWYATGTISMLGIVHKIKEEFNYKMSKGHIDYILENPFYCGDMRTDPKNNPEAIIPHNYKKLISKELFRKVQEVKAGYHKKPYKYADKPYIYRGLITCPICGYILTPEVHRTHIYYHCTNYGNKHREITGSKPAWIREDELTNQFGELFKQLQMPQDVLEDILRTLKESHQDKVQYFTTISNQLNAQYAQYENRIKTIYEDRLDKRITVEEYDKRVHEYRQKQEEIRQKQASLEKADENYYTNASTLLELANRAYDLFMCSELDEKRQFLGFVLQNANFDGKNLDFTLKKPFDTLVLCAKRQNWLPLKDVFMNREIEVSNIEVFRPVYFQSFASYSNQL